MIADEPGAAAIVRPHLDVVLVARSDARRAAVDLPGIHVASEIVVVAHMSPMRFSMRVAAMLFTSGVVCWLLTWQMTKPIGMLRTAARRFADGDLAARVGLQGELQRGDELSDLAGEFDRMAGRIQQLITSQQQLLADISDELRSLLPAWHSRSTSPSAGWATTCRNTGASSRKSASTTRATGPAVESAWA